MSSHKVKLTLDRNGNVATVSPEAVVLLASDSATYKITEPRYESNWVFLGAQFSRDASDFKSIEIGKQGKSLTLGEHIHRTDHDTIAITLLYALGKTDFYPPGPIGEPSPLPVVPVRAYDPMIINR